MKISDQKYDEDENGKLDFREFSRMIESHRARYFLQIQINWGHTFFYIIEWKNCFFSPLPLLEFEKI